MEAPCHETLGCRGETKKKEIDTTPGEVQAFRCRRGQVNTKDFKWKQIPVLGWGGK